MSSIQIPTCYYGYNHKLPFAWQEVIRLEGSKNYTVFVLANGHRHISAKTIGNYEAFLPRDFVRVHKGCIVHQGRIKKVCKVTKTIILTDGFERRVARRRWAVLMKEMDGNNSSMHLLSLGSANRGPKQ
jgi:DNA-binding LytR/AlgR family response regulator